MKIVETNLFDALANYPSVNELTLAGKTGNYWKSEMSLRMRGFSPAEKRRIRVGIIFDGKIPVAWAWVFNYKRNQQTPRGLAVFIFVNHEYRRLGYGSSLYEWSRSIAKRHHKKLISFPWDDRSHEFYTAKGAKHTYSYA
jgi:hypothetical protein